MHFRTQIQLQKETSLIDYSSNLLLIGSCFSNSIGDKLKYYKFNAIVNPFGIIFQPKAIEKLVLRSITNTLFTQEDLVFHNERWHCFDVHSDFSNVDKNFVLTNLNSVLKQTKQTILKATHIVITLGTAWVYRYIENNNLVANCHKISQKKFQKELLSVSDVLASLNNIAESVAHLNKDCSVIYTLSPVRHLKDGFIENQQSKAHLLTAIHQIVARSTNIKYFSSYEIMLDDLRDYRFYKTDRLHPNQDAINYIWKQFAKVWLSETVKEPMKMVKEFQNGLAHRPFNKASKAHRLFLKKLAIKKETLKKVYNISF